MNIKLLFTLLLIIPSLSAKKFTEDLGDGMTLVIDDAKVHVQKNGSTIGVFKTKAEFVQQRPDLAALSKKVRPPSNFDHSKSLHGLSPIDYDVAEQMARRAKMSTNDYIDFKRTEQSVRESEIGINRSKADINRAMDRGSLDYWEGKRKLQELEEQLSAQRYELQLQAQRATQNFAHSSKPPEQSAPPQSEKLAVEGHQKTEAAQNTGQGADQAAPQESTSEPREPQLPEPSASSSAGSSSERSRLKEFLNNPTLKKSASMAGKVALHVATYEVATSLYQHMRGPTEADIAYAQASGGVLQEAEGVTSRLEEIVRKGKERREAPQRRLEELRAKAEMFAGLDSPIFNNFHEGYSLAAQLQEQGRREISGHIESFLEFAEGVPCGAASEVWDAVLHPIEYARSMTIGAVESMTKLVRLAASFDSSFDPQMQNGILGRLFFDSLEEQQAAKELYKEKMSLLVRAFSEMPARKKGELVGRICTDIAIQGQLFKAAGTCIRVVQNTTRELDAVKKAFAIVDEYSKTFESASRFFKGEEALATAGAGVGEIGSGAPKGLMNTLAEFNEAPSSVVGKSRSAAQGVERGVTAKTVGVAGEPCPATCPTQYEKLKEELTKLDKLFREQQNKAKFQNIPVTKHGMQSLINRGFSPEEASSLLQNPDIIRVQHDGAKVLVKKIGERYHFATINEKSGEVITAIRKMYLKGIVNLSKNYGWEL